ncbi:enoyl-CoA delta isomerase 2-like [Drosophila rhopaloa]|uniref:Enoyl-CoA delta isomerase 2, mitochondrial n=1 Tax=Drosophila rhopaloa TaxID=1041015 RepID=A0ABM5HYH8_DRORH|nr:enoyl-CoA delta isomerase 2-like [Drosophila rhopaloa]
MSYQGYQQLLVEQQGKLLVVKFNNSKKKDWINRFTYQEMTRVLTKVNEDEGVNLVVFTGVGDIFTAGNDLTQSAQSDDIDVFFKQSNAAFKAMVLSFVNCKKIVFALVNGPAIGIGATIVGLSDVAWCSETAYFHTPFTKLGLVPEGGSSYTGPSRATPGPETRDILRFLFQLYSLHQKTTFYNFLFQFFLTSKFSKQISRFWAPDQCGPQENGPAVPASHRAFSYMLPLILGRSKASEILLLNERLSAQEAYQFNFVSRVFKTSELDSVIWPKLRQYSELPTNSLLQGKRLIKEGFLKNILEDNEAGFKQLLLELQHSEFFQAITGFSSRNAKSKL